MAKQLSVLQVLPALNSGGVERGTLEIASALVQAGHRSLVMSAGGSMVNELIAQGSAHLCWPIGRRSIWMLRLIPRLKRLLLQEKIDIVHVRSRAPAWLIWLAWRQIPANQRPHLVSTIHGLYSVSWYSAVMLRSQSIIAVSDTVRRYILDNYPKTDPARITVIPRGIDPQQYPKNFQPVPEWIARWQQAYPQLLGKKVLLLPGRITRLKGHKAFLNLVARLVSEQWPVHGVIVGGAESYKQRYLNELHQHVAVLQLEKHITFTGRRNDLREIMSCADIVYSLSSKPESFGRTVAEALSLGRPVLGWSHGGVGELLSAHFPAGKVSLNDMAALYDSTVKLLETPPPCPLTPPPQLSTMREATLALYSQKATTNPHA